MDYLPHYKIVTPVKSLDLDGKKGKDYLFDEITSFLQKKYKVLGEGEVDQIERSLSEKDICVVYCGEMDEESEQWMDYLSFYYRDELGFFVLRNCAEVFEELPLQNNNLYFIRSSSPFFEEVDYEHFLDQYAKLINKEPVQLVRSNFHLLEEEKGDKILFFNGLNCDEETRLFFFKAFNYYERITL